MKTFCLAISLIIIIGLNAQDNVPIKSEIQIKTKGKKVDLFLSKDYYYLVTKNLAFQHYIHKIDRKTGEILSKKEFNIKYIEDSTIVIDENGNPEYKKTDELVFTRNVKFRIEYDDRTYLENHSYSHLIPVGSVNELPEYFDGEINGYLGINTIFKDSIYFSSKLEVPIDKNYVVDFIYNEPNHFIVINKLDEAINSSGNNMYYTIDSKIYYTNKNGELIWKIDAHGEILNAKYRADLECGNKTLFESVIFKEKLILFYQLYIVIYDLKTGEYEFIDTKKGPHWKCFYKNIENKIFEYSNKEIREIDLEELIKQ